MMRRPWEPTSAARQLALTVVRASLNVSIVLTVYFLLPLTRPFSAFTVAELIAGLALVSALSAWQIHAVMLSRYPALRAAETLALTIPLILVLFAATYVVLDADQQRAFNQPMTRVDALYFVVTVFATVGFGDIVPLSTTARVLTTVQMLADLALIGLVVRAMFSAVQRGQERGRQRLAQGAGRGDGHGDGRGDGHGDGRGGRQGGRQGGQRGSRQDGSRPEDEHEQRAPAGPDYGDGDVGGGRIIPRG